MAEKSPKDIMNRASWILMETSKDAASTNILSAVRNKQLDVKADQVQKLLAVVQASIEEGYHRGFKAFTRSIDQATAAAMKVHVDVDVAKPKKKP